MTVIERPAPYYTAGLLASKPSPGRRPIYPALPLPGCASAMASAKVG
jgi:hypothetical protein